MCPDRDGGISPSFSSSLGQPCLSVRRLPPRGALTARLLCTLGVLCLLISLPMKGGYGLWNREPYSTWDGIITLSRAALFFPFLLPPLLWWLCAMLCSLWWAFRPYGPRASLAVPMLAGGFIAAVACLLIWMAITGNLRTEETNLPAIYGGYLFALGSFLILFSTLPGAYYWFRYRLFGQNKAVQDGATVPPPAGGGLP